MTDSTFLIVTRRYAAKFKAYQMKPLPSGGVALYDYYDKCVGVFPCIVSAELVPEPEEF